MSHFGKTWALTFAAIAPSFAIASECDSRILEMPPPRVSGGLAAHTLLRGDCFVDSTFDISTQGKAINIVAKATEDRCSSLERSVISVLEASEFSVGKFVSDCEHRFNFVVEDDT